MTAPIFDVVTADLRNEWAKVDPDTIAPEWWLALLGHVPDDPKDPGDLVLAVIALCSAREAAAR